jgi:Glu-tRNA(Gln) amidotransferase subunit E-like FAD-binding protein
MDYAKIGLKAGLEIHQQLDTGKLFSRTPSLLRSEKPDFEISRRLHKVAGETGNVDIAVEYEASLDREFVYQGYNDTISLIEMDEAPPRLIDSEALDECLKVALLLNCSIYPVTQIMRKTVIDGSNTSGFQRTVLIGHDGYVETSFGKVGIETIALEEDAARIIEKGKKKTVFRLDRLGIPLIEITTKPDLKKAEDIKECALKLGEILRACKVKRGIGTIRQDLNVSIKKHDRVEIKGFQDPKIMIKTVDIEIERQLNELKKGKNIGGVRNVLKDGMTEFLRPMPGGARMYPETDLPLLRIGRDRINKLKKHLPKLRSDIKGELKKRGLGDELIDLVLKSGGLDEFSVLMKVYDKDANLVGKMVSLWRQEFATKMKKSLDEVREILTERVLEEVLEAVREGKLHKGHVQEVMWDVVKGGKLDDALKVEKVDDDKIEEEIRKIVKSKPGLRVGGYMGLIIGKLGKSVDKKRAMEILNKVIGDEN